MSEAGSGLFAPFEAGAISLKNRIVMAPMTRCRADREGVLPAYAAEYYAQRAGAGLIVSEATDVSAQAVGYARAPGIWTEAQVRAWEVVTRAVHDAGGVMVLQLWHTGRLSYPSLQPGGGLPVAPSAIKPEGQALTYEGMKDYVTPRALDSAEIPAIVEDYRIAARGAKEAGFDGVEIHSANNYLLEQFLRDSTNQRTDEYGGSIENRMRFPMEVARAVTEVWGGGERVGIRLSPVTEKPGGAGLDSRPMELYGSYVDALSELGLAYLHVIEGSTQETHVTDGPVDFRALRGRFKGAYMANNGFDRKEAEAALAAGDADLVSFARPFLANPDLVERLRSGAPLADAPKAYWYSEGPIGYADWPAMR